MVKFKFVILFSTLVMASTSFSATHEPSPDTDAVVTPPNDDSQKKKAEKDLSTLTVAPPQPPPKSTGEKIYFPYSQSISPRLGAGYFLTIPSDPPNEDQQLFTLFGLQYMMKSVTHRHWEIGIDVISESRAYLNFGLKWISTQTEKFRPFFKAGISQRWDRQDGLEALVDFKSYSIRGTAGWELLLWDPASLRFDFDVQAGTDEVTAIGTLGYSWPW